MKQKITPNLWFDHNAKEAVDFYISVFKDGKVINTLFYPNEGLADFQKEFAGKELAIEFDLVGERYVAINAGPEFKFSEAVSFSIACKDQDEIDYYFEKLSSVQAAAICGWCVDKYGLSWQIVPENMAELMNRPGAFTSLMKMKKIIIADFDNAKK